MSSAEAVIRRLDAEEAHRHRDALGTVLLECVHGGASVSFLLPFSQAEAKEYFESILPEITVGRRVLLAAFVDGTVAGAVQVILAMPPNQPHRAEIAKLLVRPSLRRRGLGERLMQAAELVAAEHGRTLLVLDTAAGSAAEKLYSRLGWTRAGCIPGYATLPGGALCDTVVFWKKVSSHRFET